MVGKFVCLYNRESQVMQGEKGHVGGVSRPRGERRKMSVAGEGGDSDCQDGG